MSQHSLKVQSVLASSRQSILYKVSDGLHFYVLKVSKKMSPADLEAFEDEFETLTNISHPVIPKYHSFYPDLFLPDWKECRPAILMEYVTGTPLSSIEYLNTKQLKKYILDLGQGLLTLLIHGVLYTDLHPGNLILQEDQIRLIDYTRAYYYERNPYPSYTPKISYQLDQNLKGQQLLTQALTHLVLHLIDHFSLPPLPVSLTEMGMHPKNGLLFSDFLKMLSINWQ